jgi:1-acyl-sn-glycerol-3-phosphate acyltransferase
VVFLRPRDFGADAKACIGNLRPSMQISGREHIPVRGPCVITINHYHRPGFGAQWLTFAVSAQVPVHVHWVMTGEFMDWGRQFGTMGSIASRFLLKRIAHIYNFTTMPPMPPRPGDVAARAASVRAVLEYVRSTRDPVVGLAPEGCDSPNGILTRPATGLGRFGLLLSTAGLAFIPAGAYEADGAIYVRFGERYRLTVPNDESREEKDECAMQIIMKRIAGLLPVHLRGEFA